MKKFLMLEWKQFFRSSYWQKSLAMNIFLGFLALYMLLNFLVIGIGIYFILKKEYPEQDPLHIVNSVLIYWFLGDLIIRYLGQKLPGASIRPLLILPVKKKEITRYILIKSTFSFWVFLPLMAFVPFAVVLWNKGYDHTLIVAWLTSVIALTLSNNYLNYLINKTNKTLFIVAGLLLILGSLDYFDIIPFHEYFARLFNSLATRPWLALIPVTLAAILYRLVYRNIYQHLYLDDVLKKQTEKVQAGNLKFVNRLGETGTYISMDIKKILRNKRTKGMVYQLIFIPLMGILYIKMGKQMENHEDLLIKFVFPAIYMLGTFSISYGNYIPAWDSAHYPFIMAQNVNFKKYLESKWWLLNGMTFLIFLLTIPYAYYGWDFLALLFAVFIFVIGFLNWVILWLGAYNSKRLELNQKASFNSQGLSARNFLTAVFILIIPLITIMLVTKFFGLKYSLGLLILMGLPGIIFKEHIVDKLSKLYIKRKYKTLHGFKQQV